MADMKSGVNPLFLREEDLRQGMELLFFAYRDFVAEPDAVLARMKLGRAHHRALYFIVRHPGTTVNELLGILRITKQSLSRILNDLMRRGFVEQRPCTSDRRKRRLHATAEGVELERRLSENQRRRIARAYRQAGAEAVEGFRKVMAGMLDAGMLDPPPRFDAESEPGTKPPGASAGGGARANARMNAKVIPR